jgi:hypothetical protein
MPPPCLCLCRLRRRRRRRRLLPLTRLRPQQRQRERCRVRVVPSTLRLCILPLGWRGRSHHHHHHHRCPLLDQVALRSWRQQRRRNNHHSLNNHNHRPHKTWPCCAEPLPNFTVWLLIRIPIPIPMRILYYCPISCSRTRLTGGKGRGSRRTRLRDCTGCGATAACAWDCREPSMRRPTTIGP